MLSPRIEDLINAILDGEASSHEVAELQTLVGEDAGLASQLADRIAEHRLLGLIHQPFDAAMCVDSVMDSICEAEHVVAERIISEIEDSVPGPPRVPDATGGLQRSSRSNYMVGLAAGVALSLLIASAAWLFFPPSATDSNMASVAEAPPIATLLLEEDCDWVSGADLGEGQRLAARTLELASGVAMIRFDGGAELVMTGEASLVLQSAGSAELRYGAVVIRAAEGAEGFELATPASPLIDLGTEFAVRVDRKGTTEVHVLDGEVEYLKGDGPDVLSAAGRSDSPGPARSSKTSS